MIDNTAFAFPKSTFNEADTDLPVYWVKTDDELYALIDQIDNTDKVALDTEFIKRDAFFPILALVQVNTGKGIYLVDAPRLDLADFWQALAEVPMMIWYACGEDLGIFYLLSNCPPLTNIFDVQVGVAYLTGNLQVGYSRAVSEILGVPLAKTQSQSNWLIRPLSQEQESYAADDVRYLLALFEVVKNTLDAKKLFDCVLEDCLVYASEIYERERTQSDKLYLDYIAPDYTQQQITVLQKVVAWRDELARATNRPRSFVVGKQALREIIETLPKNLKQLSHTTMNRTAIRLYGDELVKIIADTQKSGERAPMPRPIYVGKDKPFKNSLKKLVGDYSQARCIPEPLLLKNRWIDELLYLVATSTDDSFDVRQLPQGLQGYRADWVLQAVLPMLSQHKTAIRQAMNLDL